MGNNAHDNDRAGIEAQGDNHRISSSAALNNGESDLLDYGADNRWWNNEYETANQ